MTLDETIKYCEEKAEKQEKLLESGFECAEEYQKIAEWLKFLKALIVEKQIPKKIIKLKYNEYGSPYICPICEADQTPTEFFTLEGGESKEKHTHCWKCGQKIDWSVEE